MRTKLHLCFLAVVIAVLCLAFSAFYELVEWWTALATGEAAQAFLGTQGDIWDSQWDMFLALCGAVAALVTLSKVHDRALARLVPGCNNACTFIAGLKPAAG